MTKDRSQSASRQSKRVLYVSSLSLNELWALYTDVEILLSKRIHAEKRQLEERLAKLNRRVEGTNTIVNLRVGKAQKIRRKYPPVVPKFRNPSNPSETWTGRGKQPRWLVSKIMEGNNVDDFLIHPVRERQGGKK